MRMTPCVAGTVLLCWFPAAVAGRPVQTAPQDQQPSTQERASQSANQESETASRNAALVESIRRYSYERREEAVASARKADAEIDRRLEALQTDMGKQWSGMADAARIRSQDSMRQLRERRTDLAEWYGGLRHGSAGVWSEVTTGFADSYHAMADALRRARDEFQQQSRAPTTAPEPAPPVKDERKTEDAKPPAA